MLRFFQKPQNCPKSFTLPRVPWKGTESILIDINNKLYETWSYSSEENKVYLYDTPKKYDKVLVSIYYHHKDGSCSCLNTYSFYPRKCHV